MMPLKSSDLEALQISNSPFISTDEFLDCFLCSASRFEEFSSGYDYELDTCSNKWIFLRCLSCGHVQLNPRPNNNELSIIYPSTYYSYSISKKLSAIVLKGKDLLDWVKLRTILRHSPSQLQSYLDVGCGDGRYMRRIEGMSKLPRSKIYGLELDQGIASKLQLDGFSVFNQRLEECNDLIGSSFSLVTMFHVIEHLENPAEAIRKIAYLLEPGGIFAIETPNIDSLDARIFKSTYWGGYHFPRHWHLFNESTLTKLLGIGGLEIVNSSYQTGHSFWMYSLHHFCKYKLKLNWLSTHFDPLRGLFFLIVFTGFDKVRSILGFRTSSILIIARKI
jgi:2-polyprenyl-3-methyl-5-hydroxy-6-metoxy-1,4-benzoquinol methylase